MKPGKPKRSVGLHSVASFEAVKGTIVLLLACGLMRFVHKDLADVAERLTRVLHANPDGKLSNLFLELANHGTDRSLWVLAMGAVVYAAVHWVEAYGLWREKEWAQWFELLSTALYVPPELYELLRHPDPLKWAVLVINVVVLVFMLILRAKAGAEERQLSRHMTSDGIEGVTLGANPFPNHISSRSLDTPRPR